jgi:hypothetical protein
MFCLDPYFQIRTIAISFSKVKMAKLAESTILPQEKKLLMRNESVKKCACAADFN